MTQRAHPNGDHESSIRYGPVIHLRVSRKMKAQIVKSAGKADKVQEWIRAAIDKELHA
jgi:hypothetical protein